jgi:hypothetical protein
MRRWVSTELPKGIADHFKQYLRNNHIIYEASECGNLIHFEVLADRETVRKANVFLEVL